MTEEPVVVYPVLCNQEFPLVVSTVTQPTGRWIVLTCGIQVFWRFAPFINGCRVNEYSKMAGQIGWEAGWLHGGEPVVV